MDPKLSKKEKLRQLAELKRLLAFKKKLLEKLEAKKAKKQAQKLKQSFNRSLKNSAFVELENKDIQHNDENKRNDAIIDVKKNEMQKIHIDQNVSHDSKVHASVSHDQNVFHNEVKDVLQPRENCKNAKVYHEENAYSRSSVPGCSRQHRNSENQIPAMCSVQTTVDNAISVVQADNIEAVLKIPYGVSVSENVSVTCHELNKNSTSNGNFCGTDVKSDKDNSDMNLQETDIVIKNTNNKKNLNTMTINKKVTSVIDSELLDSAELFQDNLTCVFADLSANETKNDCAKTESPLFEMTKENSIQHNGDLFQSSCSASVKEQGNNEAEKPVRRSKRRMTQGLMSKEFQTVKRLCVEENENSMSVSVHDSSNRNICSIADIFTKLCSVVQQSSFSEFILSESEYGYLMKTKPLHNTNVDAFVRSCNSLESKKLDINEDTNEDTKPVITSSVTDSLNGISSQFLDSCDFSQEQVNDDDDDGILESEVITEMDKSAHFSQCLDATETVDVIQKNEVHNSENEQRSVQEKSLKCEISDLFKPTSFVPISALVALNESKARSPVKLNMHDNEEFVPNGKGKLENLPHLDVREDITAESSKTENKNFVYKNKIENETDTIKHSDTFKINRSVSDNTAGKAVLNTKVVNVLKSTSIIAKPKELKGGLKLNNKNNNYVCPLLQSIEPEFFEAEFSQALDQNNSELESNQEFIAPIQKNVHSKFKMPLPVMPDIKERGATTSASTSSARSVAVKTTTTNLLKEILDDTLVSAKSVFSDILNDEALPCLPLSLSQQRSARLDDPCKFLDMHPGLFVTASKLIKMSQENACQSTETPVLTENVSISAVKSGSTLATKNTPVTVTANDTSKSTSLQTDAVAGVHSESGECKSSVVLEDKSMQAESSKCVISENANDTKCPENAIPETEFQDCDNLFLFSQFLSQEVTEKNSVDISKHLKKDNVPNNALVTFDELENVPTRAPSPVIELQAYVKPLEYNECVTLKQHLDNGNNNELVANNSGIIQTNNDGIGVLNAAVNNVKLCNVSEEVRACNVITTSSFEKMVNTVDNSSFSSSYVGIPLCIGSLDADVCEPVEDLFLAVFEQSIFIFVVYSNQVHVWKKQNNDWNRVFFHTFEMHANIEASCLLQNADNIILVLLLYRNEAHSVSFMHLDDCGKRMKIFNPGNWFKNRVPDQKALLCSLDGMCFSTAIGNEENFQPYVHTLGDLTKGDPVLNITALENISEPLNSICKIEEMENALMGLNGCLIYVWDIISGNLKMTVDVKPDVISQHNRCVWSKTEANLFFIVTTLDDGHEDISKLIVVNPTSGLFEEVYCFSFAKSDIVNCNMRRKVKLGIYDTYLLATCYGSGFIWDFYNNVYLTCFAVGNISSMTTGCDYLILGLNQGSVKIFDFNSLLQS